MGGAFVEGERTKKKKKKGAGKQKKEEGEEKKKSWKIKEGQLAYK